MKKLNYLWMIAAAVVLASCNGDLEERVRTLEGKVAVLEAQQSGAIRPMSNNPAQPQPEVAEPEVKPDGPLPAIQFQEESFDFGNINDGDIVEHTFKFKNTGEAPLIISNASATCGCTVPQWPKEPIPVGGEGEILVRFNSKNKPGRQAKTVTVTANTYPSANKVRINANVLKASEN